MNPLIYKELLSKGVSVDNSRICPGITSNFMYKFNRISTIWKFPDQTHISFSLQSIHQFRLFRIFSQNMSPSHATFKLSFWYRSLLSDMEILHIFFHLNMPSSGYQWPHKWTNVHETSKQILRNIMINVHFYQNILMQSSSSGCIKIYIPSNCPGQMK